VSRPSRTTAAALERLAERERAVVDRLVGVPPRPACELHGWSPDGLCRSNTWGSVASMCPHCAAERERRRREGAEPAVEVVEINPRSGGRHGDRMWAEIRGKREAAGEVFPGSVAERDLLQLIDSERRYAIADDNETAHERRIRHRDYWRRKLQAPRRQTYQPHPARAGD
jgi:hypothetical protein